MPVASKSTHLRKKISTTVSPETHQFLEGLVKRGRVSTLAEAIDLVVRRTLRTQQRARLERDTAAYFASLPASVVSEEIRLEAALAQCIDEVSFDE